MDPKIDYPYLSLTYFQQWVLLTLYFSYRYTNERGTQTESNEYLKMNACMSAMVPGFDEEKADRELTELLEHNLIQNTSENSEEYKIKTNGAIYVRNATNKIHELLENPDFDSLVENITGKAIVGNLRQIRSASDYAETDSTMKKIIRFGISNISAISQIITQLL